MELTCDGKTTKAPLLLEGFGIIDCGVAVDDNGVEDKTVLVSLDFADHVGLSLNGAIVVNDTKAALQSDVDGHLVLGDGVHGGRDEWGLEGDTLGDGGIESHGRGSEANVTRQQQEVIVSQAAVLGGIHELVEVKAIASLVLAEHVEGRAMVQDLGGAVESGHFLEE